MKIIVLGEELPPTDRLPGWPDGREPPGRWEA